MTGGNIQKARVLLAPPTATASPWPMLGAAAMAATAAVLMAGVMVLGPGVRFEEPPVVDIR
jgi:hypothetical protein